LHIWASRPMQAFYEKHYPANDLTHIDYCAHETARLAMRLGIEKHAYLLMCNWHRESEFVQNLESKKEDSYGVTQVRRRYHKELYEFWKKKGIELGSENDPTTQIAFGVAVFKLKLDRCKGNAYEAIRAYNGDGPGARYHRKKVRASLRKIYGMDLQENGKYRAWPVKGQK